MNKFIELSNNKINITPEMETHAQKAYDEISELLNEQLAALGPDIFPQGSFRLKTIIRPIAGEDYDLDFVCRLNLSKDRIAPGELKRIVGDALKTRYIIGKNLIEKNRCWRVDLPNFHVDVLPAIPETDLSAFSGLGAELIAGPIAIPDKELKSWKSSNPKGYAAWFESQSLKVEKGISEHAVMNKADPLPKQNTNPTILQSVVKIMKYHRDINFKNNPDDKPISIILTTLAAHFYAGEQDIANALRGIVGRIMNAAPTIFDIGQVPNPVLPSENFADKWKDHPERKAAFRKWVNTLHELAEGYYLANGDMDKINKLLAEQFKMDANAATHALKLSEMMRTGAMGVGAAGALSPTAVGATAGKPTSYYGTSDE